MGIFSFMRKYFLMSTYKIAAAFCGLLSLAFIGGCSPGQDTPAASVWEKIVIANPSVSERLAISDFQRYVGQVSSRFPASESLQDYSDNPSSAIIILQENEIREFPELNIDWAKINEQGYCLLQKKVKGKNIIFIASRTSSGTVNGVYGLLKEAGFGFYLGSESVPESLAENVIDNEIYRNPVFKVRGVLPWYNFFNSPTAWEPSDHRVFVDQLIRSGANFITFHSYDHEPFAALEKDGKMVHGAALFNSKTPTWGTNSTAVKDFGFGTDKLYHAEYFGAKSTLRGLSMDDQIRLEQSILKDALDYAKKRGLYTSLGFSISGDPTNQKDRDKFINQFENILKYYESLDYVFLWQRETKGAQGHPLKYNIHILPDPRDPASLIVNYGKYRWDTFSRIVNDAKGESPFWQDNEEGRLARAAEGARLEMFAKLADRILSRYDNAPKIVISGWGGDERLLSAEYYDGLDKILPKDMTFSSLDHIVPRERVDKVYGELPPERNRWPIPWLEYDGDEWQPQPFVHVYEKMMQNIHQGGSQGYLAIHWRTKEVEENYGYMLAYSWNPDINAKKYFTDMAQRLYDVDIAPEMAEIHMTLDKMGYRWVGGRGQVECGGFTWGPGNSVKVERLKEIRKKLVSFAPEAKKGNERLGWLINRIDWVVNYYYAEKAAREAEKFLADAKAKPDDAIKLALKAKEHLESKHLANAMHSYTRRITTKGEYGVLATANTKAVPAWRDLVKRCNSILGDDNGVKQPEAWTPEPEIVMPQLIGSVEEGEDVVFDALVIGGNQSWLHFRPIDSHNWRKIELTPKSGWVFEAKIPADMISSPGLVYGISFSPESGETMDFGPKAITVMPKSEMQKKKTILKDMSKPVQSLPCVIKDKGDFIFVEWPELKNADYYELHRNGKKIIETVLPYFPDFEATEESDYFVKAYRIN